MASARRVRRDPGPGRIVQTTLSNSDIEHTHIKTTYNRETRPLHHCIDILTAGDFKRSSSSLRLGGSFMRCSWHPTKSKGSWIRHLMGACSYPNPGRWPGTSHDDDGLAQADSAVQHCHLSNMPSEEKARTSTNICPLVPKLGKGSSASSSSVAYA